MAGNSDLKKCGKHTKIQKLSCQLGANQAALITSETNVRYMTDFANSEGTLLIAENRAFLLVDFRYGEAARKFAKDCDVIVFDSLGNSLKELINRHHISEILIEASNLTVHRANLLNKIFRECGCKINTHDVLDKLLINQRIIKSDYEIEQIKTAQRITEEAYTELLNSVKVGVRESSLALELEYLMKKKGASGVSFDLITIAGEKTSMPHGVPGENTVKNGDFVTFDIGAVYNGYHSDMTRTVAVGNVSDEQREIYSIVKEAQLTALKAVKAGIRASDVDKAARDFIESEGFGDCFRHSTGHGVGLEIHEAPNVSPKSSVILSKGMIITVEPGIYLPGKFGVRIEDMGAVTESGYDNFASLSKDLIIL